MGGLVGVVLGLAGPLFSMALAIRRTGWGMVKLALECARLGECYRSVYGPMPACSGRCLRRRQRGILEILDAAIRA